MTVRTTRPSKPIRPDREDWLSEGEGPFRAHRSSLRCWAFFGLVVLASGGCRPAAGRPADPLVASYLDRYFAFYPSRATQAGRHEFDDRLETLTAPQRSAWLAFNRAFADSVLARLASQPNFDDRIDLDLLGRQIKRELFDLGTRDRPRRDPLFWSTPIAEATIFLLLRPERPLALRFRAARHRVEAIPGLAATAEASLATSGPSLVVPEFALLAAGQIKAAAVFYREGFVAAGASLPAIDLDSARVAGLAAARALDGLAGFCDSLATRATGNPRLGLDYSAVFALETGLDDPVDSVLAQAERDLELTVTEAARYGRSVWDSVLPGVAAPVDDRGALRLLFGAVARVRDSAVEPYLAYWQTLVPALEAFVRAHDLVTLPPDRTLVVGTSPPYFAGQSVGGVYGAGPFEPGAVTFLFVPVPGGSADAAGRASFFADFNRPFTKMIAAHELMPGHYLQGRIAAHGARPIRSIFADGVYTEGWGTFVERIMLEAGWGGPLEWLAHYKKQLENTARTIVDIRVHTKGLDRAGMVELVRDRAIQGDQLARNMWIRTLTTAPQITTYYLGNRQLRSIYLERKTQPGFVLGRFIDRMMSLGSVPISDYRQLVTAGPR